MTWYKTGTVSVTNGSPNVTLASGNAQLNIFPDDGFVGPDGRTYAILQVNSATQFVLSQNYKGATATGQDYVIIPTADHIQLRDMLVGVNTLIDNYETISLEAGAGRFQNGTALEPGVRGVTNPDTGLVWNTDGTLGISVNGAIVANFGGVGGLNTGEIKALSGTDGEVHLKSNSIEIGKLNRAAAGTAFLDFHSSINSPDYDTRIASTGGTSDVGRGAFTYTALGGHSFLGAISTTGGVTINNSSNSTLLFSRGGAAKWLFGNASNDVFYLNKGSDTLFLIDPEGPEAVGTPEIRTYLSSFAEVHSAGHAKTGSMRIIGFSGIAFNDNTTNIQNVYGIYGEAIRDPGTGPSQASEFNGANGGNTVDLDPYNALGYVTTSTWLSAGLTTRPDHNNPLSAAGVMINNGGTFRRGWVLRNGALDPAGPMDFMAVPKDTRLSWYAPSVGRTDQIFSTSTTVAGSTTLVMGENSVNFYNSSSGKPFLSLVNGGASAIHFPQLQGGGAGAPVRLIAAGDSANIDLELVAKGLGRVRFGAYATSGDTPVVGYIVVKDSSGTERKLAVIA